ncbi:MAG: hypothetical protein Q9218_004189 [Villophora microphyllina]
MASSSAFKSEVYQILAGPEAKVFHVHANVLAQSKVLANVVSGNRKESQDKSIVWARWSVSAVEKFLEWLYTGDYKCPYPTKPDAAEPSPQPNCNASDDLNLGPDHLYTEPIKAGYVPPRMHGKKGKKTNRYQVPPDCHVPEPAEAAPTADTANSAQCLPRLQDLHWPGCRKLERLSQAEEYEKWTGHQLWRPDELDYEDVFMIHAELYVMACHYIIDDLKNMVWQRLRSVLVTAGVPVPGTPLIGNLASLVHYTFKETGTDGDHEDPLRMLVTAFAALHFTKIKGPETDVLIMSPASSDKEFVVALTSKMAQQMNYLEATASKNLPYTVEDSPWMRQVGQYHRCKTCGDSYD